MLNFKPEDLNRIIQRQVYLNRIADEDYDAYANKITIVQWRQKWIWDFLGIDVRREEEHESDTMENCSD
jgi:hypothetical protein